MEEIINVYSNQGGEEVICFSGPREAAMNFVGNYSFKNNFSIMRRWDSDGKFYYDCGPELFYTYTRLEAIE